MITDFTSQERIILRGFDPEDVKITQHSSSSGGLSIRNQDFWIDLRSSAVNRNEPIHLIAFN